MTSGPQHYRRAEELLAEARGAHFGTALRESLTAEAQVHATLALAAAAAYPAVRDYCGDETREPREWARVTS